MEFTEYANWQTKILLLFGGIFGNFHGILKWLCDPMYSTISRGTLVGDH